MNTTSQVIVNMDSRLKSQAMKKARTKDLSFSTILNSLVKAFVKGKIDVDIEVTEQFNEKTRRQIERARKDYAQGKNISPPLRTIDEMRAYIES